MKQGPGLALLLAASVAAGAWWFRPAPETAVAPPADADACGQASTCTTVAAADTSGGPATGPEVAPAGEDDPVPAREQAEAGSGSAAAQPTPPPEPAPPAQTREDGIRLREEADRLLAEGRVPEGLRTLREAAEANPTPENWNDLGNLLGRLTVFDEAARSLRRAAELDPDNADRWIALANAWYRATNPGEAWKAEKRARQAEPGLVLGRDSQGMRVRRSYSGAGAQ